MNQGRIISIISLVLGAAGLTCGIIALCNMVPRENSEFDYLGLLVGILSLLVLFTVGWQIYTIIDTKSTVDKQNQLLKDSITKQDQIIDKLQKEYDKLNRKIEEEVLLLVIQRDASYAAGIKILNASASIPHFLKVLNRWDFSIESEDGKGLYEEIMEEFKEAINESTDLKDVINEWENISVNTLDDYIKSMAKHNDSKIIEWLVDLKREYLKLDSH